MPRRRNRPAPPRLSLELLPETFAICRLEPDAPIPTWAAQSSPFLTVSRTANELSITTVQSRVPTRVRCERDYRAVRVRGPLPFPLSGILAAVADPLAAAGLSLFAISTYDTDYVLVKAADLKAALKALAVAGHVMESPGSIRMKRIYERPHPADGRRILVDRLWPRGLSKIAARIDHWARNVAPSTELRRWYGHEPAKWKEFRRRYFTELDANPEGVADLRRNLGKGTVTFLYSSREERLNNAAALREYLEA